MTKKWILSNLFPVYWFGQQYVHQVAQHISTHLSIWTILVRSTSSSSLVLQNPSHLQITNRSFHHTAPAVEPPTFWISSVSAIIFYITPCHLSNSLSQKTKNSSLSFFFSTLVCTTFGPISPVLTLAHFITATFLFFDFVQCLRISIH